VFAAAAFRAPVPHLLHPAASAGRGRSTGSVAVTMPDSRDFNGFAGYSLPDDWFVSDRAAHRLLDPALDPFVGRARVALLGGAYPGTATSPPVQHPRLIPARAHRVFALGASRDHLARSTPVPGDGRTEHNVSGCCFGRTYSGESRRGLVAVSVAVMAALGRSRADQSAVALRCSTAPAGDHRPPTRLVHWLGSKESLRCFPSWRVHIFGHTISELFVALGLLPVLTFSLLYAWPFIEARVTRDRGRTRLHRSPAPDRPGPDRSRGCLTLLSRVDGPFRMTSSPRISMHPHHRSNHTFQSCCRAPMWSRSSR